MSRKRRNKPTLLGELLSSAVALALLWIIIVAPNLKGLFDPSAIKAPLVGMFGIKGLDGIQLIYWLITLLTLIVWLSIGWLLIRRSKARQKNFANIPTVQYNQSTNTAKQTDMAGLLTLRQIQSLSPDRFEAFVADLIRQRGYKAEVTRYRGDHGIDIVAYSPNDEKEVVQCKKYYGQVGEPVVRDFYGAMMHEQAVRGWFVTTGVFTAQAVAWAKGKPIDLIDGKRLLDIANSTGVNNRGTMPELALSMPVDAPPVSVISNPPLCPVHGIPMVIRLTKRGQYAGKRLYGCPKYPECREIVNIDP